MTTFRPDLMARAAVTRIENADPRTVDDIPAAMGSYAERMTKAQLVIVVGCLAKRVLRLEEGRSA